MLDYKLTIFVYYTANWVDILHFTVFILGKFCSFINANLSSEKFSPEQLQCVWVSLLDLTKFEFYLLRFLINSPGLLNI